MKEFEYLEVKSIDQAISLLKKYGKKAKILAGGTDLLNDMRAKVIQPQYVINIKPIPGIDSIQYIEEEGLSIGALSSLQAIADSPVVQERFPILSQTTLQMASLQIRNKATVGGNLCHAAPSADTAPPLIALGAKLTIMGSAGERYIHATDFFKGPGLTDLGDDEILTKIQIPTPPPRTAGVYLKGTIRMAMELAMVGVAVVITRGLMDNICDDIKIVLGAVAPTPIRAKEAEKECKGKKIDDSAIERAAQVAQSEARPITDCRCSVEHRRGLVKSLTERALRQAWEMARNGGKG
jgi:carbon-monoxide dehydrogenase medium subunit